jgi:hypothetical protein
MGDSLERKRPSDDCFREFVPFRAPAVYAIVFNVQPTDLASSR